MDSLFFWLSKLLWLLAAPDSLLVLLLTLSFLLLYFGARRQSLYLLGSISVFTVVTLLFPVGGWLLHPLESRFAANPKLPGHIDGVIVLAGSELGPRSAIWRQTELGEGSERNWYFQKFIRDYPKAKHVFTGGSGSMLDQQYKGATVARNMLIEQGLDISNVVFEEASRNTYENAKFSMQLINPEQGQNWLLITSAFHMPRSVGIFSQLGWQVIPFPVDHRSEPGRLLKPDANFAEHLKQLTVAVREWLGLVAYYLSGKTSELLPGQ